jgi:hypothetical protein
MKSLILSILSIILMIINIAGCRSPNQFNGWTRKVKRDPSLTHCVLIIENPYFNPVELIIRMDRGKKQKYVIPPESEQRILVACKPQKLEIPKWGKTTILSLKSKTRYYLRLKKESKKKKD